MNNEDEIPYNEKIKPSVSDYIWGFGCTRSPEVMWKNKGYHRLVIYPHCNQQLEVARYTRKGNVVECGECGKLFRFLPSF